MQTQKKIEMKQRLLCRVSLKLIPISHNKDQVLEVGQPLTVSPRQITLLWEDIRKEEAESRAMQVICEWLKVTVGWFLFCSHTHSLQMLCCPPVHHPNNVTRASCKLATKWIKYNLCCPMPSTPEWCSVSLRFMKKKKACSVCITKMASLVTLDEIRPLDL